VTALTLRFAAKSKDRFDLSSLTPERLAGLSAGEIEALPVGTTREKVVVGDVFKLKGKNPAKLRLVGTTDRCDRIGQGLKEGDIVVDGDAGAYLGVTMRRGSIRLLGSAGPFAGGSMAGGVIEIEGDVGERAAGMVVGERFGMRGGRLSIKGKAGPMLAERMRRGLIVVEGSAAEYACARTIAGTILIKGRVGPYAGYAMRRGTLILTKEPKDLLPTFVDSGVLDFEYLRLLSRQLRTDEISFKIRARARRLMGDMAVLGKGEMLILV
jgi:formylmethanofuran dehydrogenase subunit C